MLEAIRTFWGKLRGQHGERSTIVEQGFVYRCTKCQLIFLTRTAGEDHKCQDQRVT